MIETKHGSGIFKIDNQNKNVYVIGDIHGDYQVFIHCLVDLCKSCTITELINDKENNYKNREFISWKDECSDVIVFCGDIIHRKRFTDHVLDDECSDVFMLETLLRLKEEAIKNKGDILIILGNHEIMNILQPNENTYTSDMNLSKNIEYFENKENINKLINNSYAWIKINDALIAHGGLCSDYLDYLEKKEIYKNGDEVIEFINENFRRYFIDFDYNNIDKKDISYFLFIDYDFDNKKKHNLFWCREWGYNTIDCDEFKNILEKIKCNKMIIAHCPQFLSPSKPKMINFECFNESSEDYNLARVDLGMSRSFEYNLDDDKFINFIKNNFNRKISILKLNIKDNLISFNYNSVITNKLSCLQYLLIKYGKTKKEWDEKKIITNWVGFKYLDTITELHETITSDEDEKCMKDNALLCLLYPLTKKNNICSIELFNQKISK
jgi:hypothetical protein